MNEFAFLIVLLVVLIFFFARATSSSRARKGHSPKTRGAEKQGSAELGNVVLYGKAYVIDGDTLVIQKQELRLFGIDAPEFDHPYGKSAKSALIKLCNGHVIRAEIMDSDIHGRKVARCTLPDGRDLSAEMVKLGLAIDWRKFSGGVYRNLETEDARKKLWLADARQKGRMDVWEKYAQSRRLE
jgi:endonuclease YncB( thermonuclease family)